MGGPRVALVDVGLEETAGTGQERQAEDRDDGRWIVSLRICTIGKAPSTLG